MSDENHTLGITSVTVCFNKSRWGQWCRHDDVFLHGAKIGCVQTRKHYYGRRFGHRMESHTTDLSGAAVLGTNAGWLVRRARELVIDALTEVMVLLQVMKGQ